MKPKTVLTAMIVEEDGERFIEFDYTPLLPETPKPQGFPIRLKPGDNLKLTIDVCEGMIPQSPSTTGPSVYELLRKRW